MRTFQNALAESGADFDLNKSLLAIDDAYEWLHTHKFFAQSNAIFEFLNSIRWGIRDYLTPEYTQSKINSPDGIGYSYTYPADIADEFARASYWDLLPCGLGCRSSCPVAFGVVGTQLSAVEGCDDDAGVAAMISA